MTKNMNMINFLNKNPQYYKDRYENNRANIIKQSIEYYNKKISGRLNKTETSIKNGKFVIQFK